MTERFTFDGFLHDDGYHFLRDNEGNTYCIKCKEFPQQMLDLLNALSKENEQLKEENNKLHTRIFEMRTNMALDRTEISEQDWKNQREFLKDLDLW